MATLHTPTGTSEGIRGSVQRANEAQQEVNLRYGLPTDDEGWVRCSDLVSEPDLLTNWADRLIAWLNREYGEAPDRTVTGYLLSWYLTVPAQVGALLFHTARRVPYLEPAGLAMRFGPDHPRPDAIAVLDDRFGCLTSDPAADETGATPVADDAALAALLREQYATHAAAFLAAIDKTSTRRARFGRRTLWGSATDSLDGAFWRIGQYCGNEAEGAANAALVLPSVLAPFTTASTLRPVDSTEDPLAGSSIDTEDPLAGSSIDTEDPLAGSSIDRAGDSWTRRRDSCCFHYVLRQGIGPCATCPRVCER